MASTSAIGPVCTAALAKLQADVTVTALVPVGRIVDQIPPRPVFPYVLVESSGERPFNTLGAYGSIAGLRIRLLSQYGGDAEVAGILNVVKGCLEDAVLTVTGYPSVTVIFQDVTPLVDFSAQVTREWIVDFDVRVHQT